MVLAALVGAIWRGAEPEIPVQPRRDRIFTGRPVDAGGPFVGGMPDMDLADLAEDSSLDQLDASAEIATGAPVVPDLRDHSGPERKLTKPAGVGDRVRERLLTIDVLARLDGCRGDGSVPMIRSGDDH